MKLTQVEVQGYRTFVEPTRITLSDGMNVLVGRNNCGKSNLLSAITLAMDADADFDERRDAPSQKAWSICRIALDFHIIAKLSSPEETLLRYAQAYEQAVGTDPDRTLASQGRLRLITEFRSGVRQDYFQAAGTGARRLSAEDDLLQKLLKQFRKTTRYILVRSGESLESLLRGRFRDILHVVLRENLQPHVASAENVRLQYVKGLQKSLLKPVQDQMNGILGHVFPEITSAELVPDVPLLDQTLANMRIDLHDGAKTDLLLKGTGVRGGVLLALLRYLADKSRRSIVFAVEEPEAFLHPGAQEDLREEFEELVEWDDVTLLVTTHSPFMVSRARESQVVALSKDADGVTYVRERVPGASPHASAVSELFRDPGLADVLTNAVELPFEGVRAVLVVEGQTDEQYLRIAANKTGRASILAKVRIVPAGGATKASVQAILLSHRAPVPVLVMLDHDQMGIAAAEKLKALTGFRASKEILSLSGRAWVPNVALPEAEDLWPGDLYKRFIAQHGDSVWSEQAKVGKTGHTRYGLSFEGKATIADWLAKNCDAADCKKWAELLDDLDDRINQLAK